MPHRVRDTRDAQTRLHQKSNFANPINAESTVHPSLQKYFAVPVGQIIFMNSPVSRPQEGRIAIVTDVGRGMRWTRQYRRRTMLIRLRSGFGGTGTKPAERLLRKTVADGEVVWA